MVGLGVLAVFAAVVIYVRVLSYDRVAARHLPPDTIEVARVDVERVLLYEPVRKHWFPLADEIGRGPHSESEPRLERIHRVTKLELGLDLREIVLGRGPSPGEWVLVLGGKFPHEGVVAGIAKVLTEEGTAWTLSGDGQIARTESGLTIGQADDGVIIIGPSEDRVRAALPESRVYEQLGIPLGGNAALAAEGKRLSEES